MGVLGRGQKVYVQKVYVLLVSLIGGEPSLSELWCT